jgi:endo-1,4-beta-xylanase
MFALAALFLSAALMMRPAKGAEETLREFADRAHLLIGTQLQEVQMHRDPQFKVVAGREFNLGASISVMRFSQPEQGHFNFGNMDQDIQFAREHNMKLMGTAMVYRAMSTPPWLNFTERGCGGWSRSALAEILTNQIQMMVRHGGDNFYGWEVVNEDLPFHNGCWGRVLGPEDYIAIAYKAARDANPNARLMINGTFGPAGIDMQQEHDFFASIRRLKARGVPIDQVGTEMHWDAARLHANYLEELNTFMRDARDAGVEVDITELDVEQGPPGSFPDPDANQKKVYHDITRTCLRNSNCVALMVFGVSDKSNWPAIRPRDPHPYATPLLFDLNYQRKPAYYGVLEALKEGR